jgi:hypothetical protein
MLRDDLLSIANTAEDSALVETIQQAFCYEVDDWQDVRKRAIQFLIDPWKACMQSHSSRAVATQCQCACAAYILGVGTIVSGEILVNYQNWAHALQPESQVAAALTDFILPGPLEEPSSEQDVWVDDDTDAEMDGPDGTDAVHVQHRPVRATSNRHPFSFLPPRWNLSDRQRTF